jgi:hypothetical protein
VSHYADDAVLVALKRADGDLTQEEIVRETGLEAGPVAASIKGLVSDGFLSRSGDVISLLGGDDPETPLAAPETPAPAPTGDPSALTVADALAALPGGLRFRAEVILAPDPYGTLRLESLVRVIGLEA